MYARVFFAALILTASLATALVYGWGGVLAERGTLMIGTVVALTAYLDRLYGPLTALSNVQRRRHDGPRLVRPGLRGARPPAHDRRASPTPSPIPRGPALIEFDHVDFGYPSAEEVSLASLESVAVLEQHAPRSQVLYDVSFAAEPGQLVALVGPVGGGEDHDQPPRPAPLRRARRRGADQRRRRPRRHLGVARGRSMGVVTQDAHLFHDTIRANLLYAKPDATDAELIEALDAAHILPLVESLPDGLDTLVGRPRLPALGRREAAHRHRPAAAQGARHRRPRRGDRPPRLRVRGRRAAGAQDRAGRAHLARDRPPPLDRARRRPDPRRRGRADRRAGSPRRAARRGRALRRALHARSSSTSPTTGPHEDNGGQQRAPSDGRGRVRDREPAPEAAAPCSGPTGG